MSPTKSARWPSPTTFVSPTRCRRRGPARLCAGCSRRSPPAATSKATPPRWKTSPSSPNSAPKKNSFRRKLVGREPSLTRRGSPQSSRGDWRREPCSAKVRCDIQPGSSPGRAARWEEGGDSRILLRDDRLRVRTARRRNAPAPETLFIAVPFGRLGGLPVLPPDFSLRLLPYGVPHGETWKRRVLR